MNNIATHLPHVYLWMSLMPALHQLVIDRVHSKLKATQDWKYWGSLLLRYGVIGLGFALGFIWSWEKYGLQSTILWTVLPLAGLWLMQRFGGKSETGQAKRTPVPATEAA